MQLSFSFAPSPAPDGSLPARDLLTVGRKAWNVTYVRHRRARHYVLRLEDDGSLRVTIPRGGSKKDAERFARHKAGWIERERYRRTIGPAAAAGWRDGSKLLLRGEEVTIHVDRGNGFVTFGEEFIEPETDPGQDLKPVIVARLRRLAERELPARLMELAAASGCQVSRVTVRSQKSRWGSCSPSGRISLNWRLIQVPDWVRDYVLLHELTHLKEPNHSERFWSKLEDVCPRHREARAWLHGFSL